jgi:hypothetical protein
MAVSWVIDDTTAERPNIVINGNSCDTSTSVKHPRKTAEKSTHSAASSSTSCTTT